jgi:hypothetical protein
VTIPTLDVLIERRGHDWHWALWDSAVEYVYTRPELLKTLRTYGTVVSRMMGQAHFRLTARGRFSGRVCAQWEWSAGQPLSDPWVHWPAWHNLSFAAQLHVPPYTEHDDVRMVETGGTDVTTLRLRPVADNVPPMPLGSPHGHWV